MNAIINLPAFILAGILLNLTPGADTLYILGRSIAQGKKAGIYSALGIVTGVLCHTAFAAFGLSLIIAKSATAFNLIKYVGAVYLGYLGVKLILTKGGHGDTLQAALPRTGQLYISGILTNLLNPKVALFFLVFLPQFIRPAEVHNPLPFILLGIIFIIPGTIWCLALAVFAALISKKLKKTTRVYLWFNRITGSIFIGLGLKLALISKK